MYLSIKDHSYSELQIKKSIFKVNIFPIDSEESAKLYLEKIKIMYGNANHHCYAYVLNENNNITRYSDNGEPSGTAGLPILNSIKYSNLHNIIIIVSRYFGGIKLGAGGLIRAYSKAATTVINNSDILEIKLQQEVLIIINYNTLDSIKYWLSSNNFAITNINYSDKIYITFLSEINKISIIKNTLITLTNNHIIFNFKDPHYSL